MRHPDEGRSFEGDGETVLVQGNLATEELKEKKRLDGTAHGPAAPNLAALL
jgi:hypothetical protein